MANNDATVGISGQLPIRNNDPDVGSFDIVATYHRLLADDPELTMPMATIEALIEALGASSATTVFETMKLVEGQSERLRESPQVANPMAVCHGSDFFKQYLVRELRQLPSSAGAASKDQQFEEIRQHLLRNARLFATRAKEAREQIASEGRLLIPDNSTILTHGGSRVVGMVLGRAAERVNGSLPRRFRVIYAISESRRAESEMAVATLREKGIRVATIPEGGVAHIMQNVNIVIVGAEVITAQGGIISRLGTYQIAKLAKIDRKPFYVAAEQHKLGQTFPTSQSNYGIPAFKQDLLDFQSNKSTNSNVVNGLTADQKRAIEVQSANPVDFTPPDLITNFICDHGVKSTVAMEHQVIDMFVS
ncbi:translation initiation factor eIF-2B alpha subunit [Xylaria bambusicola]|uniref:translation initiation factor eIF-2B alpha subunit n=1 Tax=Xylaria bambusicola TaxID=326684 RepID=UPI002007EE4C|nr:translation initiation factor eIF-2B alpha subunit [Xylaria bambusicola]KAI0525915.1 translation initiation factor eIF-2B alpha subunit [Xylaria bambusicola]